LFSAVILRSVGCDGTPEIQLVNRSQIRGRIGRSRFRFFYDLEAVNIACWAAASGFFAAQLACPLFAQSHYYPRIFEYKFH
jgi:hypothetical protein